MDKIKLGKEEFKSAVETFFLFIKYLAYLLIPILILIFFAYWLTGY